MTWKWAQSPQRRCQNKGRRESIHCRKPAKRKKKTQIAIRMILPLFSCFTGKLLFLFKIIARYSFPVRDKKIGSHLFRYFFEKLAKNIWTGRNAVL